MDEDELVQWILDFADIPRGQQDTVRGMVYSKVEEFGERKHSTGFDQGWAWAQPF